MRCARWALLLALGVGLPSEAAPRAGAQEADSGIGRSTASSTWRWSRSLASSSAAQREAALAELSALGPEELPAIRARLVTLRAAPELLGLRGKLLAVRRIEDGAQPGAGVPEGAPAALVSALAGDPSPEMQTAVELLALLHALEQQQSAQALHALFHELLSVEPRALRAEALRSARRLGPAALPPLLRARTAPEPALRKLAIDTLDALGCRDVGRVFAYVGADESYLPDVLAAYAEQQDYSALPWTLAQLDQPTASLRSAARSALARYAEPASPWLREYIRSHTGREPAENLGLDRLLAELRPAGTGPSKQRLAAARAALGQAQLGDAERLLDELAPAHLADDDRATLTAIYFELARHHDGQQRPADALRLYRRVRRSAAASPLRDQAHARVLYLESEQQLARGIADLSALQAALAADPQLAPAVQLYDELSGQRSERERSQRRRLGLSAATLLAFAGLLLWRTRRTPTRRPSEARTAG